MLELKQKWWSAEEPCSIDEESSVQMKPENVAGLFVILGVGIVIAFGVAVFEFVWNAKRVAKEEGVSNVFFNNNITWIQNIYSEVNKIIKLIKIATKLLKENGKKN